MNIISAAVKTYYRIEFTYEDFVDILKSEKLFTYRDKALVESRKAFKENDEEHVRWYFVHLTDYGCEDGNKASLDAIAEYFGFDGWTHCGLFNKKNGKRSISVYNDGADNFRR